MILILWVNAFADVVFSRMVNFYSPTRKVWLFSPSILALVFVTLDIVSFVVQLVGGGMAGPGSSTEPQKEGLNIYMGGIGIQEGFIILFLGLVIKFHRDQLQAERFGRLAAHKVVGWKWLIWVLYGCLLAITIRIVYRLVEFSAGLGVSNPLPYNEPLLYVLESASTWFAILVWYIAHPGRFIYGIRRQNTAFLTISPFVLDTVTKVASKNGITTFVTPTLIDTIWNTIQSWRTTTRCTPSWRMTGIVY